MKHRFAASLLSAAFCLGAAAAQAQPLSLKQGFEAAWERTPEARAAALWRDAAQASQSAAQRWAQGAATLELSARSDRWGRDEGSREYEAALAVPLWLAGERAGTAALAQTESTALAARMQAARWRLAAQVREAFWAWHLAQVDDSLAQQRLASAQQLAGDVQRRWQAGDMARADSHQAEGAVAQAQAQLAEAETVRVQALHAWMALTGSKEPPEPPLEVVQQKQDAPLTAAPDVHPALGELAAQADVAQRQWELTQVQTRANTEVVLGTTRERDARGERYAGTVFVGVRLALGRLPDSDARRISAHAEWLEAQTRLEQEEAAVRARVQAAQQQWQALRQAQQAADQRAALAREVRGFVDKSFALGESDWPTRQRVEQEAFEAEREAARARVQVQAAAAQWRQALGLLPE